jgi:hypothetical protein
LLPLKPQTATGKLAPQISYQLTPADIEAIQAELCHPAWGAKHWGRRERLRLILSGASLAGFVGMLLMLFSQTRLGVDVVGWDMVGVFIATGMFMGWWWGKHKPSVPASNSPIYEPMAMTLRHEALEVQNPAGCTHINWEDVTGIDHAGDYLIFRTRQNGTHIVPKRAFASKGEAQLFFEKADTCRQEAMNDAVTPEEILIYRLTGHDAKAFFKRLQAFRERRGWREFLPYTLIILAAGIAGFTDIVGLHDNSPDDGLFFFGVVATLAGIWLLNKLILRVDAHLGFKRYMKQHPLPQGEVVLERWKRWLKVTADGESSHYLFQTMGDTLLTPDHLFIRVGIEEHLIVPRSAFASPEAMQSFAFAIGQSTDYYQP